MADNVAITAGSGTTIATDDISSVHYQRVKLVDGTLDATTAIAAGGGVEAGALRVTIANDSTGLVSVDDNGGALTVDNGGTFAVQATLAAETTKVIGTVNVAASQSIGLAAGTNLAADVDIAPRTTGGWSVANFTSGDTYTALTNTAQVIKASAGKFGGYYIFNPNAVAAYVMVYNIAAASVTVGTSTAILVFAIPPTAAANLEILAGIPFGTAMSCAAATTGGGNGALTTALEAMIWYK